MYKKLGKERASRKGSSSTALPVAAQVAEAQAVALAAGAVLLAVAAHPAAGNSTIKNASPEAGIFKSDKVSLMPGL